MVEVVEECSGKRVRVVLLTATPGVCGGQLPCVRQDVHDCCLTCLGIQYAEEAFVDVSCSSCGDMTISELHNRLA